MNCRTTCQNLFQCYLWVDWSMSQHVEFLNHNNQYLWLVSLAFSLSNAKNKTFCTSILSLFLSHFSPFYLLETKNPLRLLQASNCVSNQDSLIKFPQAPAVIFWIMPLTKCNFQQETSKNVSITHLKTFRNMNYF